MYGETKPQARILRTNWTIEGTNDHKKIYSCKHIGWPFSHLNYTYLQTLTSTKATVEPKKVFEAYYRSMNVPVQHYHGDKDLSVDNEWFADVSAQGQSISCYGVGALFHGKIRDLQDTERMMSSQARMFNQS